MMKKGINTKFREGQLTHASSIQLKYDTGLTDNLLILAELFDKQIPIQKQSALIYKRMRLYAKQFNLKSFLHLALSALMQLYIDALQSLNLMDRTAHKPVQAMLWASVEPESAPYISFL